jgi:hypothetical protein
MLAPEKKGLAPELFLVLSTPDPNIARKMCHGQMMIFISNILRMKKLTSS